MTMKVVSTSDASAFRKLRSIYVFSYFPFGFEGRMWDLIVSVPDHCLSFYFLLPTSAWQMTPQGTKWRSVQTRQKMMTNNPNDFQRKIKIKGQRLNRRSGELQVTWGIHL